LQRAHGVLEKKGREGQGKVEPSMSQERKIEEFLLAGQQKAQASSTFLIQ
jgi:hypothetical protein